MISNELRAVAQFLMRRCGPSKDGLLPNQCLMMAIRIDEIASRVSVLEDQPVPERHRKSFAVIDGGGGDAA